MAGLWDSDAAQRGQRAGERVATGTKQGIVFTTQRKPLNSKHLLTAFLVLGLVIVLIRAVADYEPQANGTIKGKIAHPKGQYGPLPIAAGLIGSFFVLSFFVASGGLKGKVATIFGGVIVLTLGIKSTAEIEKVANTFPNWGKGKLAKGTWESTGTQAGTPFGASDTGNPGGGGGAPKSTNPEFPVPPGSIKVPKGGCPAGWMEEGDDKGHKWCTKIVEG